MSRVLFNGRVLREPAAAAKLRIGVQPAVNPNATNRVVVIGESDGGTPQSRYELFSFADAREILRGGDSLKAIAHIFNPSPAFGGAAQVDFIRAQACTSATLSYADATSAAAFTVTSKDKGTWVNAIQVAVTAGTVSTDRVITIKIPTPDIQKGTDGVLTATNTFEAATAKFLSKGARIGDQLHIGGQTDTKLAVFTIASVVSETKVTLTETPAPSTGTALSWRHFTYDRVHVSGDLTAITGTTNLNTNLVNYINSVASDIVTAALGDSAATLAASTTSRSALAGGSVTAMTTNDIVDALVLMRTVPVNHIYVAKACGSDTSKGELEFAGLIRGHLLNDAETPALGYIGAGLNKLWSEAITYGGVLNSGRLVYCHQTLIDAAQDGLGTEEIPGFMFAAKVAGLAAGVTPDTPLTRKPISCFGIKAESDGEPLDKDLRERLLKGGVLHAYQPPGENTFVINQGITTLQYNDDVWEVNTASSSEISLMRITDAVLNDLKTNAARQFLGLTSTLAKPVVQHWAESYLQSQVGTLLQSYKNVTVTQNQTVWRVEFCMVPAYPINYFMIIGTVIA